MSASIGIWCSGSLSGRMPVTANSLPQRRAGKEPLDLSLRRNTQIVHGGFWGVQYRVRGGHAAGRDPGQPFRSPRRSRTTAPRPRHSGGMTGGSRHPPRRTPSSCAGFRNPSFLSILLDNLETPDCIRPALLEHRPMSFTTGFRLWTKPNGRPRNDRKERTFFDVGDMDACHPVRGYLIIAICPH